jgi:4-hydroxy-tetrahydrodipicolinate synthase
MKKFQGTGVAMTTAFFANDGLDLGSVSKLTTHLIEGGIDFLVVLGTTGETATLSMREQELVMEMVAQTNEGRLPLVLGVGGNNTAEVIAKAKGSISASKPDAILSVSPYYSKPSQEGIFRHYAALAEAITTPIILYNVPSRTGSNMTAATTLRLAHAYPHIIGMKEASGNIEQCMEIMRDRPDGFRLISGDDGITLPLMGAGADGVISVLANVVPRPFSDMVRHALAGDFVAARKLHYPLMKLTSLLFAEGNPVGAKAALALLGIGGPHVRLPLWPASEGLRAQIEAELRVLGAL